MQPVSIEKCREILKKHGRNYTDEQIKSVLKLIEALLSLPDACNFKPNLTLSVAS